MGVTRGRSARCVNGSLPPHRSLGSFPDVWPLYSVAGLQVCIEDRLPSVYFEYVCLLWSCVTFCDISAMLWWDSHPDSKFWLSVGHLHHRQLGASNVPSLPWHSNTWSRLLPYQRSYTCTLFTNCGCQTRILPMCYQLCHDRLPYISLLLIQMWRAPVLGQALSVLISFTCLEIFVPRFANVLSNLLQYGISQPTPYKRSPALVDCFRLLRIHHNMWATLC